MSSDEGFSEALERLRPLLLFESDPMIIDLKTLYEAIQALKKSKDIGKYFSDTELRDELSSMVLNVRKSSETDKDSLLSKEFSHLVPRLRSRIDNWKITIPVENLQISSRRKLGVGKVTLFKFSKAHARRTLASVRATLSRSPRYAARPESITKHIERVRESVTNHLEGKTCAEIVVFGRDDKAYHDALPSVEEVLAGLKLFRYPNDDSYGRYFGIPGSFVHQTMRRMFLSSARLEFAGTHMEWTGTLFPVDLDEPRIRFMQKHGLPEFSAILKKDNRNDLEEKIVTSVLWFARATDVVLFARRNKASINNMLEGKTSRRPVQAELMSPYDRLVKLMIALETLLIFDESEPISSNLAERIAFLVERDYDSRKRVVKFVKLMYRYRSSIVHRGGRGIPEKELMQLMLLTQSTLIRVLKGKERLELNSVQSLREWFEKAKLG